MTRSTERLARSTARSSARADRLAAQARPARAGPQPGDVRGRDRRGHHDRRLADPGRSAASRSAAATSRRWFTFTVAHLAVADGRLRQPRRGARRGPRARRRRRALRAMRTRDGRARCATATRSPPAELARGDVVVVEAGEVIPGDGTVIEGIASVDESAITGESAPVIREAGGDRSAVTGGTRVLSDRIVVEITQEPGKSFLDRMIALVEGASRRKTPNEIALGILLAGLTLDLPRRRRGAAAVRAVRGHATSRSTTLIALLVALIPTTIGALLSAIGIAGMDRLVRRNVLALSGRAVEASGDVDVLLLDKTGTITLGNRQATRVHPDAGRRARRELAEAAQMSSLADETPEGRSIVVLAKQLRPPRARARRSRRALRPVHRADAHERRRLQRHAPAQGRRRRDHRAGSTARAARRRPSCRPTLDRDRAARAARRSPSRATARCSASSTSRTSSRRACASASTSCARWASAR